VLHVNGDGQLIFLADQRKGRLGADAAHLLLVTPASAICTGNVLACPFIGDPKPSAIRAVIHMFDEVQPSGGVTERPVWQNKPFQMLVNHSDRLWLITCAKSA
jgi:hypothetical protein